MLRFFIIIIQNTYNINKIFLLQPSWGISIVVLYFIQLIVQNDVLTHAATEARIVAMLPENTLPDAELELVNSITPRKLISFKGNEIRNKEI